MKSQCKTSNRNRMSSENNRLRKDKQLLLNEKRKQQFDNIVFNKFMLKNSEYVINLDQMVSTFLLPVLSAFFFNLFYEETKAK